MTLDSMPEDQNAPNSITMISPVSPPIDGMPQITTMWLNNLRLILLGTSTDKINQSAVDGLVARILDINNNINSKFDKSKIVTSFQDTPDNVHVASERLVKTITDNIQNNIQNQLSSIALHGIFVNHGHVTLTPDSYISMMLNRKSGVEADVQFKIPFACTLSKLRIYCNVNTSDDTLTMQTRINEDDGNLIVNIPPRQTGWFDSVANVSDIISEDDLICLIATGSANAAHTKSYGVYTYYNTA